MTRKALVDTYPEWEIDENDPNEAHEVQKGVMRIVRNRKRMRVLKRRGVILWTSPGPRGQRAWLWFVDHPRLNAKREKMLRAHEAERAVMDYLEPQL